MKKYLVILALLSLCAFVLGQSTSGDSGQNSQKPKWEQKVSKGVRKTEQKVGTWTKKTSVGFNHAAQRTERRYSKAQLRKTPPAPAPQHTVAHRTTTTHRTNTVVRRRHVVRRRRVVRRKRHVVTRKRHVTTKHVVQKKQP